MRPNHRCYWPRSKHGKGSCKTEMLFGEAVPDYLLRPVSERTSGEKACFDPAGDSTIDVIKLLQLPLHTVRAAK